MRLNLRLTPNSAPVPFDHVHNLTGAIHNWLGENDLHDKISLYSFGWLNGSNAQNGALHFPDGATWRISFWEEEYTEQLVDGIMNDPDVMNGMRVFEINEQTLPNFGNRYRFEVDSPVLVRKNRDDGGRDHLLWEDEEADELLTKTLRRKLNEAGVAVSEIPGSAGVPAGKQRNGGGGAEGQVGSSSDRVEDLEVNIRFDREYDGAKSKLVTIKETSHRASVCPVIVEGSEEVLQFAWCVGVGDLSGSGFGALK
jgi:CRISPR/Cas system endoribonuclease Cas6 (RAMP superfamily)